MSKSSITHFSRVQPRNRQPSGTKHRSIQVHEEDCGASDVVSFARTIFGDLRCVRQASSAEQADSLAHGAPVQRPASANPVEGEHAYQCSEHVRDIIESCNPLTIRCRNSSDSKDLWPVYRDAYEADDQYRSILWSTKYTAGLPAIPIHSCRICSQMTSCTLRAV